MAENSNIAWTDATFNPWWGCTKISPGCANCYAEELSDRFSPGAWGPQGQRKMQSESYWKQPLAWDRKAAREKASWEMACRASASEYDCLEPYQRPRVFCASMADVFEDRPELVGPRNRLFRLICDTPHLDWLLLTKRADVMHKYISDRWKDDPSDPLWHIRQNLWLGVSAENQHYADERIPLLLRTPAAVRFVSYEPALGPLSLRELPLRGSDGELGPGWTDALQGISNDGYSNAIYDEPHLDWVIAGGESGSKRRPCEVEWFESLRQQCVSAGVKFFMKQDAAPRPGAQGRLPLDLFDTKQFPTPA